jgi:hypothetical protein
MNLITVVNEFTFSAVLNLVVHPTAFCGDNRGNRVLAGEAGLAANLRELATP